MPPAFFLARGAELFAQIAEGFSMMGTGKNWRVVYPSSHGGRVHVLYFGDEFDAVRVSSRLVGSRVEFKTFVGSQCVWERR